MLPVLRVAAQGEARINDVVETLASQFALTPEERAHLLPSGKQTTFANRVQWAKSYLGKAGLVELTRRAHFQITDRGRKLLVRPPERIDIKFLSQFPEFTWGRNTAESNGSPADTSPRTASETTNLTPDEIIRQAHQQLEAALAAELLQRIRASSPAFFESTVVRLLSAMGYGGFSAADISKALVGGTNDGGIDGVIDQDPLGLDRIYVQAKRYGEGKNVGAPAIRDFFGSLDRFKATKGLFVTTSTFSTQARETAEHLSKRIVLIDGDHLSRLLIRHGVACRVEETLTIKKLDEEFFE